MPYYTLPFDTAALAATSRRPIHPSRQPNPNTPSKKRKRASSTALHGDEDDDDDQKVFSSLSAGLTNPLSLTPDEVAQYRLAGLDLDQELPGSISWGGHGSGNKKKKKKKKKEKIEGWPHRGLPYHQGLYSEDDQTKDEAVVENTAQNRSREADETAEVGTSRNPHLRMQHLSVLTTLLHRCLLEGDIVRAKRAWALLLRAQVNGKGVSLHGGTGYWGVGAELLVRDGEVPPSKKGRRKLFVGREEVEEGSDEDNEMADDTKGDDDGSEVGQDEKRDRDPGPEIRWGTAEGLEKAREYYERLILQHPYRDQFRDRTNALDFWPALIGCEIYGIQYDHKEVLRQIDILEQNEDEGQEDEEESVMDDDMGMMDPDPEAYYRAQERRERRSTYRRQEKLWQRREDARQAALTRTEKIAARMDELMGKPAYTDSIGMQRLRGMIALYIGDLSVPELPPPIEKQDGGNLTSEEERETSEREFLALRREADHARGLEKRLEERRRAKTAFDVVKRLGGRVDEMMKQVDDDEAVKEEKVVRRRAPRDES